MPAPQDRSVAQGHIPALDGIRGIAIIMVLLVHFFMGFTPQNHFEKIVQMIAGRGTLGIDLFFMLSGLLITGILIDTKNSAHYYRNFLIRRFFRIFPIYYAILLIFCLTLSILPKSPDLDYAKIWDAQPWAWSYLFNFYIAKEGQWSVPYIGHFWSLAVEEQFYVFWPVIVYSLTRQRLMQVCLVLVAAATALHFALELAGVSPISIHVLTPVRLNALCLGAWMAAWLRSPEVIALGVRPILRLGWWLAIGALITKALVYGAGYAQPELHKTLETLRSISWLGLFASLHLFAISLPISNILVKFLTHPTMIFFGKYSYGIYLLHHFLSWPAEKYQLLDWFTKIVGHHSIAVMLQGSIGIALSSLLGWGSFHYFEKHFLSLKDRFAPRQS